MKNIFHINSYYTSTKLHSELAYYLSKKLKFQSIFIPIGKKDDIDKYKLNNVLNTNYYYRFCFNSIIRILWPLKILIIWINFKKLYQKSPSDLIHAHSLIVNGLIAFFAKKKYGRNYIVTIRDTDINTFIKKSIIFRLLAETILKKASAIITLSPSYKYSQLADNICQKCYNSIKDKIHIVPNGINDFWLNNLYTDNRLNNQVLSLLFVGKIIKRKNLITLLKACQILTQKGIVIRLNVVGDGPLLNRMKRFKVSYKIVFHGNISDKNILLKIYRESDIFILPSLTETFGLVYPEAMSQGLPVIYTKNQGFDGFFQDGVIGYSVDPLNPNDIADKVVKIQNDYSNISKNAVQNVDLFTWEKVSENLVSIYNNHY